MPDYGLILPIQSDAGGLDAHLEQLADEVLAAEKAGFDAVFLPEFHQATGGAIVSPLLVMAWLSARTTKIRFGTLVLAAPLHDPVRLAEDMLMLDHATRGRAICGLGTAFVPRDFELYGRPRNKRGPITDELLDVLEHCWSGERFDYRGEFFQRAGKVTPKPYSNPAPPIWIGAHGPRGLRRAAQRADAWVCDPERGIDTVAQLADEYRGYCAAAGRPARVVLFREGWIGDSAEQVAADWGPHPMIVHRLYFNLGVYRAEYEPWVTTIESKEDFTFDLLQRGRFLYGSGEQIRATANAWCEQTGADYIALRMRHPTGPSHADTLAAIDRFGREVIGR